MPTMKPDRDTLRRRIASLTGRISANKRVAQPHYDGREATRPAKEALWARLDAEVDPDCLLMPDERRAKAKKLWQARMDEGKLKKAQRQLKRAARPQARPSI